jgi:hypothetical protein
VRGQTRMNFYIHGGSVELRKRVSDFVNERVDGEGINILHEGVIMR